MLPFFSHDAVFFILWDYPMSYLEFFGTITGAIAVWGASRAYLWSFPLGMLNVTIFFLLFYQLQLYPDMFLQVFFFITNGVGWWRWKHPRGNEVGSRQELMISLLSKRQILLFSIITFVGTIISGKLASHLHDWLPSVFSSPSSFPYADSFVLVATLATSPLMVNKKLECWIIWLFVDIVAAIIYFSKGINFVGIEYVAFCMIAIYGFYFWRKQYLTNQSTNQS